MFNYNPYFNHVATLSSIIIYIKRIGTGIWLIINLYIFKYGEATWLQLIIMKQ